MEIEKTAYRCSIIKMSPLITIVLRLILRLAKHSKFLPISSGNNARTSFKNTKHSEC